MNEQLWRDGPQAALAALGGPAPADRWQRAVALGALGRYADAATVLSAVAADRDVGPYRSLALSTRASHLRQVGEHAAAEQFDLRALTEAGTDPSARADASTGLVADAIGRADLRLAQERLPSAVQAAAACADTDDGWRAATRLEWVRAELHLLADNPLAACAAAEDALVAAGNARRHVIKSLLLRGVAYAVAAGTGEQSAQTAYQRTSQARADLSAALAQARSDDLVTLAWPAASVAADLAAAAGERRTAQALWEQSATALQVVIAGLGRDAPGFSSRSEVVALLSRGSLSTGPRTAEEVTDSDRSTNG